MLIDVHCGDAGNLTDIVLQGLLDGIQPPQLVPTEQDASANKEGCSYYAPAELGKSHAAHHLSQDD
ncbi:MAG: hypothetical protein ACOX18_01580 [Bacillota bacterium]